MPTQTYYLDAARTQPITASWGLFYKNFTLTYQGQPLAPTAPNKLAEGLTYALPDGRHLHVQLKRALLAQELAFHLDDKPLPGTATHPEQRIKQAWYALLFVAVLSVGLGLTAELLGSDALRNLGLGWATAAEGLLFLGLGWWGYRSRAPLAFYLAFALLILDFVLTIVALAQNGGSGTGGFVVRAYICFLVFKGARAAQELRQQPIVPAF